MRPWRTGPEPTRRRGPYRLEPWQSPNETEVGESSPPRREPPPGLCIAPPLRDRRRPMAGPQQWRFDAFGASARKSARMVCSRSTSAACSPPALTSGDTPPHTLTDLGVIYLPGLLCYACPQADHDANGLSLGSGMRIQELHKCGGWVNTDFGQFSEYVREICRWTKVEANDAGLYPKEEK